MQGMYGLKLRPRIIDIGITICLILTFTYCDERGPRVRRIVGGEPANVPPEDDPTVYTRFNGKSARVQGVRDNPHYVFRGIRFAKAPKGKLRFVRPQEHFLEGFVNATKYPPPCVQPLPGRKQIIGDEDCLFLNIFTPDLPTGTEGLPVIVWIHGGGFRFGSASQYGVRQLVGKQLVVVTIQYRLGSLGFLSSGTRDMPGNAALWDMALAVQFIRNYIGFFGGNPYKIIVMGQGTGASSALLVSLSNIAKGQASAVVAMSGSAVSHWAVDNAPKNTARELAEQNGCPTGSTLTMMKCLQSVSASAIIKGDSAIEFIRLQQNGFSSGLSGGLGAAPVHEGTSDGRSLPSLMENLPMDDFENERIPKIPLLIGTTRDETKKACTGNFKEEILTKLRTIPNFLDKVFVQKLQNLIGLHNDKHEKRKQLWTPFDPTQFRKYMQIQRNNFHEGISKIAEATADALFNVPTFLTADFWSKKGGPTFLYRFEHSGKMKKGSFFLNGMPLVGDHNNSTESEDTVSHGDDLAYIFDAQDLEGNPMHDEDIHEDDLKVRNHLTQMISDFARFGKVNLEKKSVSPFSSLHNNFLQISAKPKIGLNFRFCEMGLWVGLAQRLQSQTCSVLKVLDSELKNAQQSFFDSVNATGNALNKLTDDIFHPKFPPPNINRKPEKTQQEIGGFPNKLTDDIFHPKYPTLNMNKNTEETQQGMGGLNKPMNIFQPVGKQDGNIFGKLG